MPVTIKQAREAATKKRERREAREAAKVAAKKTPPEKSKGLIDRIRDAFSSEDDISRIDAAVDAVDGGVRDANEDSKRKK